MNNMMDFEKYLPELGVASHPTNWVGKFVFVFVFTVHRDPTAHVNNKYITLKKN